MARHIHADLIHAWADGAAIQYLSNETGEWNDVVANEPGWCKNYKYRVKTPTININGFEVPEPERKLLFEGDYYYLATLNDETSPFIYVWQGNVQDLHLLKLGVIHRKPESARIHSEALLSFTKQKE